jgi:hypothetical protein
MIECNIFKKIYCKENLYSELKISNRIVPLTNLNKYVYHDESETEVNTNDNSKNNHLKNTTNMQYVHCWNKYRIVWRLWTYDHEIRTQHTNL